MKDIYCVEKNDAGLSSTEIESALIRSLNNRRLSKVLLLPPDFTRFHSNAGMVTSFYYKTLTRQKVQVDVLPALGNHVPVTKAQWEMMYPGIPYEEVLVHNWRKDVIKLGEIPAEYMSEITDGIWKNAVAVEINRRVVDPSYDLIISIGQVVPHEVIGMSSHAKNLFVGVGGSEMIHQSHLISAAYGIEKIMGKEDTPVRRMFDYGMEHFLADFPVLFVMTVTTVSAGNIRTHGLFIGETRTCLREAVQLAQKSNITCVGQKIKKCIAYLDPEEFQSIWVGNKAIYRTSQAIADGGELIILAPGIVRFGEDPEIDRLLRKYGYHGRDESMKQLCDPQNSELRENPGAAAHMLAGSSNGRFQITYAVKQIPQEEIEEAGYRAVSYDEITRIYDPAKMQEGFNQINGEEIYYISKPALGLWISENQF